MSTTATLDSRPISLEAGTEAFVPLHIRNDGEIVEEYRLEVVGPSGSWSQVVPGLVSLYPGQDATASVEFRPPRSAAVQAGEFLYGVQVLPTEHPEDAVVPEGVVHLLPFYETTAELMPRTSRGRFGALHRLAVDNRGNVPITVTLAGADPGEMLNIGLPEQALTVEPGTVQFGHVRIRPVRKIWRGMSATHTFAVTATPADGTPVVLDGTHLQEPVLPSWIVKAMVALLVLALGLAALWYLWFKPAVEATAKAAVQESVTKADQSASQAATKATEASAGAANAGVAAQSAQDSATSAATDAAKASVATGAEPPPEIVSSIAKRLEVTAAAGASSSAPFVFENPDGTLKLTDLVLNNPQGDFGRLRLELDGAALLDMALENFRDMDYHFLTPVRVTAGQNLSLTMSCIRVGAPPDQTAPAQCKSAAFLSGTITIPAPR
ncbi:MAG: hypothetical protein JWQ56_1636 [Pseudarthrobacter sp.]|nr:hypothetical protein [Pseudarthrobacter sp.]